MGDGREFSHSLPNSLQQVQQNIQQVQNQVHQQQVQQQHQVLHHRQQSPPPPRPPPKPQQVLPLKGNIHAPTPHAYTIPSAAMNQQPAEGEQQQQPHNFNER